MGKTGCSFLGRAIYFKDTPCPNAFMNIWNLDYMCAYKMPFSPTPEAAWKGGFLFKGVSIFTLSSWIQSDLVARHCKVYISGVQSISPSVVTRDHHHVFNITCDVSVSWCKRNISASEILVRKSVYVCLTRWKFMDDDLLNICICRFMYETWHDDSCLSCSKGLIFRFQC